MEVYNNNRDGKWEIVKNETGNYTVTYYERHDACGWKQIGEPETYSKECAEYEFDINLGETEKEEKEMKKFEVGAMYWDTSAVDHSGVMIIKITRRTEKSVWFVRMHGGKEDGEPSRTKVFANNSYEYIMPYRYSMAPVWEAYRKVEPEQTAMEAAEETAETEQSAAGETDATGNEKEEKKTTTLLDVHTMNLSMTEDEEIFSVKVLWNDGDSWMEFADTAEAMNEFGAHKAVSAWEIDNHGTLNVWLTDAAQGPETADDNKTAAMTAQEAAACKMIHEQTTEYLLKTWEGTTDNADPFIPTVRGWLMDELQARYPEAYDKWLDSETCEDAALREYVKAAKQAAQDSAKPEAAAGHPAPQGDAAPGGAESVEAEAVPGVRATRNPAAPYDIFRYHTESGTYLFENEGEAALIDALEFHADAENALSVVRALYEITHDGGGWFSPRNHPIMLDALNAYIGFMTEEIEVFDNFPNAAEKEIAVGKLAEAKVIRDAFAADVARAAA